MLVESAQAQESLGRPGEAARLYREAADYFVQHEPASTDDALKSLTLALNLALSTNDHNIGITVLNATSRLNLPVAPFVRSAVHQHLVASPPKTSEALLALRWLEEWRDAPKADRTSAAELHQWLQSGSFDPATDGLIVQSVQSGSQARRHQLPIGAIVLRYADEPVATPEALADAVASCSADPACKSPELVWRSGGAEQRATLKPGPIGIETEALWSEPSRTQATP